MMSLLTNRWLRSAWVLVPLAALPAQPPPPCPAPDRAGLLVRFLDVGQGDAALVTTSDGRTLLVDGGPSWPALRGALVASAGRVPRVVDLLLISHNHADHIGGLPTLLRSARVANTVENGVPATTAVYGRLLDALERSGTRLLAPTRRTLTLGTAAVTLLPPLPGAATQNLASVGAVVTHGQFRVLFTGDAEPRQLAWWQRSGYLGPVTVVKAPHHGSRNGTTAAMARITRPQLAVVSAGRGNRYGHPHAEVVARWRGVGTQVLQTAQQGTLVVRGCANGSVHAAAEGPRVDAPTSKRRRR
jgi:beta-lactamase superfamily II metal-dependent hydrolase